ncbi:unnamed protein product [Camellia sinensis]
MRPQWSICNFHGKKNLDPNWGLLPTYKASHQGEPWTSIASSITKLSTMANFYRDTCPTIKNILLLDSEGKRVAVKYYSDDWPTNSAKSAFEKSLFTKTQKTNARSEGIIDGAIYIGQICMFKMLSQAKGNERWHVIVFQLTEITMFDSNVVVYKFIQDLHFFVTGGDEENELILATALQGFVDAVSLLLRNNVEKMEALENLDLILLCLDEIVDGGMILETDGSIIAGKVATHSMDDGAPLAEQNNLNPNMYLRHLQTISQALATAREHLTRSLLR